MAIYYDQVRANRAVLFINLLKHSTGGELFNLQDWQKNDIIQPIIGNIDEEGYRVIREVFILIARKNGKSELIAALVLFFLFVDCEYGSQIYSAANSRAQASIVFDAACAMIMQNPTLKKKCKIIRSQKRIVRYDTNSFYRAISAESSTAHGFNANVVVYDEPHEARTRELYDTLITSMGTRRQPLFISITTAGQKKAGLWWDLFEYAKKVKEGIVVDPSFLPVLYYAEDDDDWTDEKVWHKANPALGTFRLIEEMRMKYKRALEIPSEEFAFRRLYLNQVIGDKTKWLDIRKWKASNRKIETKSLLKRDCYAGLDLSSTTDITALVLVFPLPDGEYTAMYFYFIPEENMRERVKRDRVQYDVWAKQGYLITTPGNVLDYDAIYLKILELNRLFRICEIAYDRWEAVYLSTKLENEGFTMVGFGQGFASMSAPSKDLIKLTLSKKFHNGDHPVTNWMASNLVMRMDPAGNIKPDKAHSEEKIDGMVASIMGLDRAMRHGIERSVYEDRGVREV